MKNNSTFVIPKYSHYDNRKKILPLWYGGGMRKHLNVSE